MYTSGYRIKPDHLTSDQAQSARSDIVAQRRALFQSGFHFDMSGESAAFISRASAFRRDNQLPLDYLMRLVESDH
jgi:hypothetical protein